MVFCGYSVSWFSSLETNKNDSNSITEMLLEVAAWYPSVPILAEVVRLIPTIRYTKNVVYSVRRFVSDLRQIGVFSRVFRFPISIILTTTILLK